MIKISKEQRFELEKVFGFKIGKEIHRTYSKPKHYYLIESDYCLKALEKVKHA